MAREVGFAGRPYFAARDAGVSACGCALRWRAPCAPFTGGPMALCCTRRRSAEIRLAGLIRMTLFPWRLSFAVAAGALWLGTLQPSACLPGASSLARPLWPLPTQAAPPPYRPWLLCLREKSNPKRKPSGEGVRSNHSEEESADMRHISVG